LFFLSLARWWAFLEPAIAALRRGLGDPSIAAWREFKLRNRADLQSSLLLEKDNKFGYLQEDARAHG
jgi:hypothetical protein